MMALPLAHRVLFSATQRCVPASMITWSTSQRLLYGLHVECGRNSRPTSTVMRMYSSEADTLRVSENGRTLTVAWQSDRHESTYHSLWLRHNCRCPDCVEASSGQKLVLPQRDLQQGLEIKSATIPGTAQSKYSIVWSPMQSPSVADCFSASFPSA